MEWLGQKPSIKDVNSRTVLKKEGEQKNMGSSWMVIRELKKDLFCLLVVLFPPLSLRNLIKQFQIHSKIEDKAQSSSFTPLSPHGLGGFFVFREVGQGVC